MSHQPPELSSRHTARFYAGLSIGASVATILLKGGAWLLTDSVGLLSDAAESLINLLAALVAFWALTVAVRPPDEEHVFGHSKAEYFSSAVEGLLILGAAAAIVAAAWERLLHPVPLENLWLGAGISAAASAVNAVTAIILLRAGKRLASISLRSDALHLLTDVWTSIGVIVAIVLVQITGLLILDPIVALIVAANIVWTAYHVLRDTAHGILDTSLPRVDRETIQAVLASFEAQGIVFHALRTRVAGRRRFVDVHVLVPGDWDVRRGHQLCEEVERRIKSALPHTTVFTHLEPVEDSTSYADDTLD